MSDGIGTLDPESFKTAFSGVAFVFACLRSAVVADGARSRLGAFRPLYAGDVGHDVIAICLIATQ